MAEVTITAELAGRVLSVSANVGDAIGKDDEVVLIEAMKMEIPVASPAAGKVKSILVEADAMVEEGQPLLILET